MTVVDVNTGKFTGSGGNLEETVTKNNLEAAEEMVRQLRLRDIGGIIVIDFIDMVLESNRDLVLRRLVECLGRDRTRHQVAEVTSLGLVQMTRKRIGTGLLEAFSTDCEHCKGRGLIVHDHPVESGAQVRGRRAARARRSRGGRNRGRGGRRRQRERHERRRRSACQALAGRPGQLASPGEAGRRADDEASAEQDAAGRRRPSEAVSRQVRRQSASRDSPTKSASRHARPTTARDRRAAEQPPPEPALRRTPEPHPSRAAEPAPEPPLPRRHALVTSTRRRTARRPAGPPSPLVDGADRTRRCRQAGRLLSAEPVDIPVEPGGARPHAPSRTRRARPDHGTRPGPDDRPA